MNNIDDTIYFTKKYFSFLENEFGFGEPKEEWKTFEFHILYWKENICIKIVVENDGISIPYIQLIYKKKNNWFKNTDIQNFYRIESIEKSIKLENLYRERNSRIIPKINKFSKDYVYDSVNNKTELLEDYFKFGKNELEFVIRENADIVKRNSRILNGDLKGLKKEI